MSLERRLRRVYRDAQQQAERRLKRARSRLQEAIDFPDDNPVTRRAIARSRVHLLDQEIGLVRNLTADMERSAHLAQAIINGESLDSFNTGYSTTVRHVQLQLRNMGISMQLPMYDRNAINAVFNGAQTSLGSYTGWKNSFELVGYRIAQDRNTGKFYADRAFGRLGDNATIVRRLQDVLVESIMLGESAQQIMLRVQGITRGAEHQAMRIARTEGMRAAAQGRFLCMEQAASLGVKVRKQWITAKDEKVRPQQGGEFDHLSADGQIVELNEPFLVSGEELMYSHDPNGSAGNTINCRCTYVPLVIGVEVA